MVARLAGALFLLVAVACARPAEPPPTTAAQVTTFYITRHAEKAGTMAQDPPLTKAGHLRAQALQERLADVSLDTVYATQLRRTQQTAEPTAKAQGLAIKQWRDTKPVTLAKELREAHAGETVLVVNHSYSIPKLLRTLGIKSRFVEPGYGVLYTVTLVARGEPSLEHERYGAAPGS